MGAAQIDNKGSDPVGHSWTYWRRGMAAEIRAATRPWRIRSATPSKTPGVNWVLIYPDVGGFPGATTVGTPFTNPDVTIAGLMQYTGTAPLAPGSVYWMVVDLSDESQVAFSMNLTRITKLVGLPNCL